jgi:hypothetical protein
MPVPLPRMFLWLVAVVAFAAAVVVFAVGRPGQRRSARGTIVSKSFKKSGSYQQTPSGLDRSFRTPASIETAESYVFEVRVDGEHDVVRGSLNTIASRSFEPGQPVRLEYEARGLPFFGRRLLFTDLRHADDVSSPTHALDR